MEALAGYIAWVTVPLGAYIVFVGRLPLFNPSLLAQLNRYELEVSPGLVRLFGLSLIAIPLLLMLGRGPGIVGAGVAVVLLIVCLVDGVRNRVRPMDRVVRR